MGKGNLKISLIGPLPPPVGGTTTSFALLASFLKSQHNIDTLVVDTKGVRNQGVSAGFRSMVRILSKVFKTTSRADVVSLHVSTSALEWFGPLVLIVTKLLRKPLVVRKFGGTNYFNKGMVGRYVSHFVVRHSALYLAQTKHLVDIARKGGVKNVHWFPTSRPANAEFVSNAAEKRPCRNFIFLGHIRRVKGVCEILMAADKFGSGAEVKVDLFGPLDFDISCEDLTGFHNVRYCGVVEPPKVAKLLSYYDALLLPTYHPGEGYPGVILEAYSVGLPIICTRWQSLPEIVDDSSGVMIEPKDSDALYEAMKLLIENVPVFSRLRKGALEKSCHFNSEYWSGYFVEICKEVASLKKNPMNT